MTFIKGQIPWNKNKTGIKLSENHKRKIGLAFKGKKLSEEHKEKIRKSHLGKKFSEEHKRHMSKVRKGKKLSEKVKEKMRQSAKKSKNSGRFKKGKTSWNKGKKFSKIHRKNLSKAKKGRMPKFIPEAKKGEKCHLWKGGITPENRKIRSSVEFRLWREAVFARDNWTCQKTGIKGGKLNAHHINNFADYKELRTSIENGITLSEKAHILFHKIYGKKNNTQEQLKEFLS